MKRTQFTARRALRSALAVGAAALALGVLTPACNKSAESKKQTAAPAKTAQASAKIAKVPDLGVTKTLKGASNVAIAAPGTKPAPAKVGGAADKAQPAGNGLVKDTSTHVVKVSPPTSVASGTEGVVKVTLSPKPGWKINMDFPTSLKITPPSGVTLAKSKLRKGDAAIFRKDRAEFLIKFKAAAAGPKAFAAKFKFAMCTEETCDPKKEMLAWKVDVK